jgi:hypothetical protein
VCEWRGGIIGEAHRQFRFLTPANLATPPLHQHPQEGLDKPIVFLVLPPVLKWDKKMHHLLLVGASVKLCVLAPEEAQAS